MQMRYPLFVLWYGVPGVTIMDDAYLVHDDFACWEGALEISIEFDIEPCRSLRGYGISWSRIEWGRMMFHLDLD